MYEALRARRVRQLYHFTDQSNLALIKELGGLFSWDKLVEMGAKVCRPGGNDWSHDADALAGVGNYVHLCFLRDHPMEYRAREDGRIKNTAWIGVNIDLLLQIQGVAFTAGVANKSGIRILTAEEAKQQFDFEAIFDRLDFSVDGNKERRNNAKKYEILVPNHIPLSFLDL